MPASAETFPSIWTAADLLAALGPVPLDRVRTNPPPVAAAEEDVIAVRDGDRTGCANGSAAPSWRRR